MNLLMFMIPVKEAIWCDTQYLVRCHPKFVMKRTKVSTDILIIVDSLLIHCQWHAKQSASSINFQPTTISTNHVTSIIYFWHLLQL